jgi:hypothetical protein
MVSPKSFGLIRHPTIVVFYLFFHPSGTGRKKDNKTIFGVVVNQRFDESVLGKKGKRA